MKTRFAGLLGLVAVAGLAVGIFGVAPFGGRTAEAMKAAPTMSVDVLVTPLVLTAMCYEAAAAAVELRSEVKHGATC